MNSLSYKKYSNIFFTTFIILAICTIFFYFFGNFILFNFWFLGLSLFKFVKGIKIILFWATIIFFILMLIFEAYSKEKSNLIKDELKCLYSSNKMIFLNYFKNYIIIKNSEDISDEELTYFRNKFKNIYEKYILDVKNYIKELNNEGDFSIKEKDIIHEYFNKLSLGIINDTINVTEFIDIKDSKNSVIYEDDINFIYHDKEKLYFLKDLFIDRLKDIDEKILEKF